MQQKIITKSEGQGLLSTVVNIIKHFSNIGSSVNVTSGRSFKALKFAFDSVRLGALYLIADHDSRLVIYDRKLFIWLPPPPLTGFQNCIKFAINSPKGFQKTLKSSATLSNFAKSGHTDWRKIDQLNCSFWVMPEMLFSSSHLSLLMLCYDLSVIFFIFF